MSKRFTDTDIWDKEWFMTLSPKHKCLVRFIFDKCDVAGIWSANWTLATAYIGEKVSDEDLAVLGDRIEKMSDSKYFLSDFIEFQYGELSESCRPHTKIISILKKHNLYERVSKGYLKGIQTLEEKEEDKDKEEDKEEYEEEYNESKNDQDEFESFRKEYPGNKRGYQTELKNFQKHQDWRSVISLLLPALNKEINWKKKAKESGIWVAEWPNLQTWLNQRRWEQEFKSIDLEVNAPPGKIYSYDQMCDMVYSGKHKSEDFEPVPRSDGRNPDWRLKAK